MRSSSDQIHGEIDALRAVASRLQGLSYEGLPPSELVDVLEEYAFLIGRAEALKYELLSPFVRPSGRRT